MRRPLVPIVLAAMAAAAQAQTASIWDGVYTEAQAARGNAGFADHCARCHGADLGGTGEAPALSGPQFLSDFDGLSLGDLFDRIRTTMPQDDPGGLTRDQYADMLAFLLKANALPSGAKELDRRSEYLKAIGFSAANPHPGR
ncbi:MAG TPA: cytochrome c [Rhizomicrobium sp.]|jgi:mono/diheme cytochrome c family protein|nr:cytochrome c [Rhizomicrobium sp.]